MPTILVIDDSELHRAEIRTAVADAGDFDRVLEAGDGIQGLKQLLNESVDLVLCDLELPGLDGEKLLRVKDANSGGVPVPFLFVTGSGDRERRTRLIVDGASDVVQKPFFAPDLVARLRLHLKIRQLQQELMIKNRRLEYLSTTDEVTGLRTRRFVNDTLRVEFQRARRYGQSLSVLMADLDHFKRVNDKFGHPAGDAVLRATAERLQEQLRATDLGGRYGGEEFVVVLPHNDLSSATQAAERWRAMIADKPFLVTGGREIQVTMSVGVATFERSMGSPDELVSAADTALYIAKENGRNRVECFEPDASRGR